MAREYIAVETRWSALRRILRAGIVTGALACGNAVGVDAYDLIPDAASLDVAAIRPAVPADYWELRFSFGAGQGDLVLGAGGPVLRDALSPGAQAALDTISGRHGFGVLCPPGDCTRYLLSVHGDTVRTWLDSLSVRAFFGAIEAPVEAVLLAAAHGYTWGVDKEVAGIRSGGDGSELLMHRLVRLCDPVQVNRYLLLVSRGGRLEIRREEVWQRDAGVCI